MPNGDRERGAFDFDRAFEWVFVFITVLAAFLFALEAWLVPFDPTKALTTQEIMVVKLVSSAIFLIMISFATWFMRSLTRSNILRNGLSALSWGFLVMTLVILLKVLIDTVFFSVFQQNLKNLILYDLSEIFDILFGISILFFIFRNYAEGSQYRDQLVVAVMMILGALLTVWVYFGFLSPLGMIS